MKKLTIVLAALLVLQSLLYAGDSPSILRSTLLPGWGEHSYGASKRGYVFNGIEAGLWLVAAWSGVQANSYENDLFHHARVHGEITDPHLRSDVFLDRVSKYESMDAYNEQMRRNRQWDRIYSAENDEYWSWDSEASRQEYFDIKTDRYIWRQRLTYTFGAIALNHLVSTMDALYLKRMSSEISVTPALSTESAGFRIELRF